MTEKFDHVKARVGGQDKVFKIDRRLMDYFERLHEGSAYMLYRVIASGQWRIKDIRSILMLGLMSEKEVDKKVQPAILGTEWAEEMRIAAARINGHDLRSANEKFVHDLLTTNPPAQYALLALNVLGAALFGVKAEEAVFSDEQQEE